MSGIDFGPERAVTDANGAIQQFHDPENPQRRYLLDSSCNWHSAAEHSWGSGHIITSIGSGRWNANSPLHGTGLEFRPLPEVSLTVRRDHGESLTEHFTFTNTSSDSISVTGLGIQVPFADLYDDSETSLNTAVHAHVFTGGSWSWVLAQPMSGRGRLLGLTTVEGELWSYSVESRNIQTGSNVRGHLVLNVTDFARNPASFGGQPKIVLEAGQNYKLAWKLAWYDDVQNFIASTNAPARFSSYSAEVGSPITLETTVIPDVSSNVSVRGQGPYQITSNTHGIYNVNVGQARTSVLFHDPLKTVATSRCAYALRHQVARDRAGLLAHAFVPVDTKILLTQTTNGWSDWTDGSERIAMPLLLQLCAMRGWIEEPEELERWSHFARKHLLDDTLAPSRGSQDRWSGHRLYDTPWLAQFYNDRYRLHGRSDDLEVAGGILERAFELGMAKFLAISLSETMVAVMGSLRLANKHDRANKFKDMLLSCARSFADAGTKLPKHEVNYEQSMVGPLLNLFIDAYRLSQEEVFLTALRRTIPWLLAFSGPQPHARLNGVAIRHWDGFWFGTHRMWGDVWPHYWSTITSTALLRLPRALRTPGTDDIASATLKANMSNYRADGSATCAFTMPSTVDGRPAHCEDPQANDQDWHLVMWLRLVDEGLVNEQGLLLQQDT